MSFTATKVDDLKFYVLPQTVYNEMVANEELDDNSFYLTTGEGSDAGGSGGTPAVSGDYLPLAGGTVTGDTVFSSTTAATSTTTGAVKVAGGLGVAGAIYGDTVVGAVWNDYAEWRTCYSGCVDAAAPGLIVTECADECDTVRLTTKRLEPIPMAISDTYGMIIGEKSNRSVPVAVSGRVLVYTDKPRASFKLGDAVCSAPNGKVSRMTRTEVLLYPDRILGYVSCIPNYAEWGNGIRVRDRIWIKIK